MGQIPRRRTAAEALRERREHLARAELESSLAGLLTGRSLTADAAPAWVAAAVHGFWDIHVDPAAALPDDASPAELSGWIAGLLADAGVTTAAPSSTRKPFDADPGRMLPFWAWHPFDRSERPMTTTP